MLREQLSQALKEAMKARDARRTSTLRLILAALKDRDIAARSDNDGEPLGDAQILEMLTKMVRQRRDSIKMYEEGGRVDLATQEREEIEIIESFLPAQMDDDKVEAACRAVIDEVGAESLKDMGKIMAGLKAKYAGQMDFGKASAVVKQLLS